MAAPTPPRLAVSFNDLVCLTPSPTTEDRRTPPLVRPSTPTTATDLETTTHHSPPGEWKEVVSKMKKKTLKASTPKEAPTAPRRRTPPIEQPRKIQRTCAENLSYCSSTSSSSSLHTVVDTEAERSKVFPFWLWQVIPHS